MNAIPANSDERNGRWRLLLGGAAEARSSGASSTPHGLPALSGDDAAMDRALQALYESDHLGGLGSSCPRVARWLGDIRQYFPTSVIQVMLKDALDRHHMTRMLWEPELLQSVEPDVHIVAELLALKNILYSTAMDTARAWVRKVVDELRRKLEQPTRQAVVGSLNRASRTRRPKHNEIDWRRTIRANLKHYQADYKTIIPETRIGLGRKRSSLRDIIVCVDQSASMAASVVYAGMFSAVLASLPAITTKAVVFDTAVADLSDKLDDPVEVLFGTQLGGGTDINRALSYCQTLVRQPQETILILISDLFEGGNAAEMLKRMGSIVASGVQVITLLALSDDGAPAFDHGHAAAFAAMGIPCFACTRISSRILWLPPFRNRTSHNGPPPGGFPPSAQRRQRLKRPHSTREIADLNRSKTAISKRAGLPNNRLRIRRGCGECRVFDEFLYFEASRGGR